GLEVSPRSLLQNEFIQRQIGNRLAQPAVLELKVLQALHLLGLQPTELLAPPIIRHLAHADLADCVHPVLALRDQNIDLPQLRDDLFRLRFLTIALLLDAKTYLKSDHFNGGGSLRATRLQMCHAALVPPAGCKGPAAYPTAARARAHRGRAPRTGSAPHRGWT